MHCDYLLTLLARPDFDRTKLPSRSPQSYPAPFTPPPDCASCPFHPSALASSLVAIKQV